MIKSFFMLLVQNLCIKNALKIFEKKQQLMLYVNFCFSLGPKVDTMKIYLYLLAPFLDKSHKPVHLFDVAL